MKTSQHLLDNPWERLKSEIREGFEQISTEIVDEIGGENTSGIEKMISVVLDSVHCHTEPRKKYAA